MSLSLEHPKKENSDSLRMSSNHKVPMQDAPGTQGFTVPDVISALELLPDDGRRHCEMDYKLPLSTIKRFLNPSEKEKDFEILVFAKEVGHPWMKVALKRHIDDKIILRSSTFDMTVKNPFKSQDPEWVVAGKMFTADITFWKELKTSLITCHN